MIISRTKFFLFVFLLYLVPLVGYKLIWLARSQKIQGVFAFEGRSGALDQMPSSYSVIFFILGKDTIWIKGPAGQNLQRHAAVPLRYIPSDPDGAKMDTFLAIWGGTTIYGGIPLLILIVVFLHPEIVPKRSKVFLVNRTPFIRVISGRLYPYFGI